MSVSVEVTLSGSISPSVTLGHTVNVGGDVTAPTFSVAPASANVADTSFNITATLNEWGTVYSLVQPAADTAPTVSTIISTGESAIDTGSGVTISHTGLTGSTNYTAYVVGVDDDDNQQASAIEVDVTTASGYDADTVTWYSAGSFITANKDIMDDFVLNLKTGLTNATNVWGDIVGLWVSCWGADSNATNNAINGKNPGTFDLTYVNSPTQGSAGTAYNGTTQYARTGITPSTSLTVDDVGFHGYLSIAPTNTTCTLFGAIVSASQRIFTLPKNGSNTQSQIYNNSTGNASVANANYTGLFSFVRRDSTDHEIYRNAGSLVTSSNASGSSNPNIELYLMATNNSGSPAFFSDGTLRVAVVTNGLTANQVTDLDAAVDQLFSDLGI